MKAVDRTNPKQVLGAFLESLKTKDFRRMVKLSTATWQDRRINAEQELEEVFGWLKVLSFSIDRYREIIMPENYVAFPGDENRIEFPPGTMLDYRVNLVFRVVDSFYDKGVWFRMVRESGPYQPSVEGAWGVNPLSLRDLDRERRDDNI